MLVCIATRLASAAAWDLPRGGQMYVVAIDQAANRLIVGEDAELHSTACEVRDVNWIAFDAPPDLPRAAVKIRNRHEPAMATISPMEDDAARVIFDAPQRAITAGQAAVFYDGERVLGGGWIRGGSAAGMES